MLAIGFACNLLTVHYVQKWSGVCPIETPQIILEINLTEYLQEVGFINQRILLFAFL